MASQSNTLFFTEEQYLEFEYRSEEKHEYLDGEVWSMSGASLDHKRIGNNIYRSLYRQLQGSRCEAQTEGLRVRTADSRMYSYPDVMIFCRGAKLDKRLGDTLLNPVAVFEVLSPSTEVYDRGKKFLKYRTIETLEEYILISQDSVLVERFVKQANGEWALSSFSSVEDTLALSSVPAKLNLRDIYEQVFPQQ